MSSIFLKPILISLMFIIITSEQGGGVGVETDIFRMMIEKIAENPICCKGPVDGDLYQHLNLRPFPFSMERRDTFRMVGAAAALHLYVTGWAPHPINPIYLIFAVGGWRQAQNLGVIERVLPAKAALLRAWPRVLTVDVDLTRGSVVSNLIIDFLDDIDMSTSVFFHLLLPNLANVFMCLCQLAKGD